MDCCQLEEGVMGVKREDAAGNDPENGSPDADRGGIHLTIFHLDYSHYSFPKNNQEYS